MSSRAGAATQADAANRPDAVELRMRLAASRAAAATLAAVAVLFLVRRLAGELQQPLSGIAFVVVAITIAAIVAVVRWAAWHSPQSGGALRQIRGARFPAKCVFPASPQLHAGMWPAFLEWALPGLTAVVLLGAVTLPGTPAWAVFAAWFGLVIAEAGTWCFAQALYRPGSGSLLSGPGVGQWRSATNPEETADAEIPVGLVQQITRIRRDGAESIHIMIQAEVPLGERLAIVHLAFCPPLDATPDLAGHAVDAEDAEVRIALAETFGARLEVRLPHAATNPRQVLVEVLGSAAAASRLPQAEAG